MGMYQVERKNSAGYKMIEAKNRLEAACIFSGNIIDNDSADSDLHVTTRRDGNRLIVSWPHYSADEYIITKIK
jgi:hypothetical protein